MEQTTSKSLTPVSNFKKLALTAIIAGFSITSFSAPLPELLVPADSLVQVTSLGIQEGEMVFRIRTENSNENRLYIVLQDKDGVALYKGMFSEKNLSKTFKVPAEVGSLSLIVTNLKDKSVERYEIANERKTIEELVITTVR